MSSYSSFKSTKVRGLSPLDRRTPRNTKYSNVKSTIDTGSSMSKVELITARQYLSKRDELFKRVSILTCRELIEDYHDESESIFAMGGKTENEEEQQQQQQQQRHEQTSLIMGPPHSPSAEPRIMENSAENYIGGMYNESDDRAPFLFLDVREKKEFTQCHIKCAKSYPANNLKHDKISPELYFYKNRDGYVIVIYDLNDRMARKVATMFTEKGYENIFLMTGGLEKFAKEYPSLVIGSVPEEEEKENKGKRGKTSKMGIRPPRPEYTAKVGHNAEGKPNNGRPPRGPRGRKGNNMLTTANVQANERALGTPGKGTSRRGKRGNAPSLAGSTVSRAESLLSWNAGERRDLQTSL
jgi:centrosomal protein CEP41